MALGSIARTDPKGPGLLPCRIHNFSVVCLAYGCAWIANCSEIPVEKTGPYLRQDVRPAWSAASAARRVLELYTCRNCGTAYARAYTDDVDNPSALWSNPAKPLRIAGGDTGPLLPLDLLLRSRPSGDVAEPADYDLETGRLNPQDLGHGPAPFMSGVTVLCRR